MALTPQAKELIERPLPPEKIKQRPGKGGLTFNYITPDFVISSLNEAFEYRWSTTIISSTMYDTTAVVGFELTVWDADGNSIHKQQFGSCDVGRGMGTGEAFKGAASDALKKCATLLGLGLELYQDDDEKSFRPPQASKSAPRPETKRPAEPRVAPPKPKSVGSPAPPKPAAAAPAAKPVLPPKPGNPFSKENGGEAATTARIPAPKPMASPAPPKANPFAKSAGAATSGPSSTQISALTNIASRKSLSQAEMVALASITDGEGNPVENFDELTSEQAIQVIRAAQL